jgi:hypothetical protein
MGVEEEEEEEEEEGAVVASESTNVPSVRRAHRKSDGGILFGPST